MDKLLLKLEQEYIGKYDCQLRHILQEYSIEEIVNHIMKWLTIEWLETDNLNYAEITTIAMNDPLGLCPLYTMKFSLRFSLRFP